MHKSKDGKVVASLTEVKNKTGDIFALVDEFGEVTLTSYNKPRYRIIKIGVSEMLEEAPTSNKNIPKKVSKGMRAVKKIAPTISRPEPQIIQKKEENTLISNEVLNALKKLNVWDRTSKKEKAFISKAKQPLQ